ncbi:MAG: hypothetical protein CFE21_08225 [Bacteroidetes bacterium B1(2017)]|nr:MAG: hypothetical protein CFE21_08225 [Bacteroidetes bacterium B1(2017)]
MSLFGDNELEKPEIGKPGKMKSLRAYIVNCRQLELRQAAIEQAAAASRAGTPTTAPTLTSAEMLIQQQLNYFLWGAEELFEQLSNNGFDSEWQAISAYIKTERSVGIAFAVGSSIELPCFELGLSLEASATVSKSKFKLTLVQQVPSTINQMIFGSVTNRFTTNTVLPAYNVGMPLLISGLYGGGYKFTLAIELEAAFELSVPFSEAVGTKIVELISKGYPEAAGEELSAAIGVKAIIGASLSMEYLYMGDNFPNQYVDATSNEFKIELEANIGVDGRNKEINAIARRIKSMYKNRTGIPLLKTDPKELIVSKAREIYDNNFFVVNFGDKSITETLNLIASALALEETSNSISAPGAIPNQNQIVLMSMQLHIQILISDIFGVSYDRDIQKIKLRIEQLNFQIWTDSTPMNVGRFRISGENIFVKVRNYKGEFCINVNTKNITISYVDAAASSTSASQNQAQNIRLLPATSYTAKVKWKSNKKPLHATYLNYSSTEPAAGASASAKLFTMGPEISAEAKVKFARYRFQTNFNTDENCSIFLTQDVKVRYSQVAFSAGIKLQNYEKAFNSISYKAVSGIWNDSYIQTFDGIKGVVAMPGSGMSFGTTISYTTLNSFDLANRAQNSDRAQKFAKQLNITVDNFWDFIQKLKASLNFFEMQSEELTTPGKHKGRMFLIESTFSVVGFYCPLSEKEVPVGTVPKLSSKLFKTWMEKFNYPLTTPVTGAPTLSPSGSAPVTFGSGLEKCYLNSIYLRERLIDVENISGGAFKLGVTNGAFTASVTYSSSSDLGSEGIANIFRFDAREFYGALNDPHFQNNNFIVPPATLFFQ